MDLGAVEAKKAAGGSVMWMDRKDGILTTPSPGHPSKPFTLGSPHSAGPLPRALRLYLASSAAVSRASQAPPASASASGHSDIYQSSSSFGDDVVVVACRAIHKEVYEWFDITFDHFGRTSSPQQPKVCQAIFYRILENNWLSENTMQQRMDDNAD